MKKTISLFIWFFTLLAFAMPAQASTGNPNIYYVSDENTIYVRNTQDETATYVDLKDISAAIKNPSLLNEVSPGVWALRANLWVKGSSDDIARLNLNISSPTVAWLKIKSNPGDFVWLKSYNANINITDTKITSWDETSPGGATFDTDYTDGRAFVLAKYNADMNIQNSELAYLGYHSGEAYGVSWRIAKGTKSQYRVTGQVTNSRFHHNYYGVYTFGAEGMYFGGNEFDYNIQYGFDPHDDSNNFIVENNVAHDNGNHGFIFSRRCIKNIIRNNESYNNALSGFMLDRDSNNNVVEGNRAWGNVNGIALYSSSHNDIKNNDLYGNERGILLKDDSGHNVFSGNKARDNTQYGFYFYGGAQANVITGNTMYGNDMGVYIKSPLNVVGPDNEIYSNRVGVYVYTLDAGGNSVLQNSIHSNTRDGIVIKESAQSTVELNSVLNNAENGIVVRNASSTFVYKNSIEGNGNHGVFVYDGARGSRIEENAITHNRGYGVYIKDSDEHTIQLNTITDTLSEGVSINNGIKNNVKNNVIAGNNRGVRLYNARNNTVSQNKINGNTEYGVYLSSGSGDNTFESNTISENGKDGLYANDSQNNVFALNTINGNLRYGAYLYSNSSGNTLSKNTISGNSRGVYIQSANNNIVELNDIAHNTDYGVYLYIADGNIMRTNNVTSSAMNYYYAKYLANNTIEDTDAFSVKVAEMGSSMLMIDTANHVLQNSKKLPTEVSPNDGRILLTRSITSSEVFFNRLPLQIVPASSTIAVKPVTWNDSGDYYKRWTTHTAVADEAQTTVGGLLPFGTYDVFVNSVLYGVYGANAEGEIQFYYSGSFDGTAFEVKAHYSPIIVTTSATII